MNDATVAPLWEIGPFDLPQADMLSLNGRADRRTLSPRIRTLRMQARVMARAAHCPTFMRARLVAWVRFPDGRRRDLHNYMPTLKAFVDGLVDAASTLRLSCAGLRKSCRSGRAACPGGPGRCGPEWHSEIREGPS